MDPWQASTFGGQALGSSEPLKQKANTARFLQTSESVWGVVRSTDSRGWIDRDGKVIFLEKRSEPSPTGVLESSIAIFLAQLGFSTVPAAIVLVRSPRGLDRAKRAKDILLPAGGSLMWVYSRGPVASRSTSIERSDAPQE